MRMPFERLMELVRALPSEDWELSLGALAERWGEPAGRVADAITAVRVARGEPTYMPIKPPRPAHESPEELARRIRMRRNRG